MNLTPQQLDEVIEKYCDRVVDEMDTKSMAQMLYDMLVDSFQSSNQHDMEELICAIYDEEYWEELIKDVTLEEVSQDTWISTSSHLNYKRSHILIMTKNLMLSMLRQGSNGEEILKILDTIVDGEGDTVYDGPEPTTDWIEF